MAGKKYSAEERSELLALFARRTESVARFAKAQGVSVATLHKWQERKEEAAGSFVEITRQYSVPAAPHLRVQAGEVHLIFEGLPDAAWLAALVQKLQG